MTMVAKTLVGDQKDNHGRVTRHIFSAYFMRKMLANPLKWLWEEHKQEILPEYVGYNIGECDFIFGPALVNDHWFCYVFETKTMRFHALDSYVDTITYMRLQREEEGSNQKAGKPFQAKKKKTKNPGVFKEKQWMASKCRDCFIKMLVTLQPQLFENEDQIDKEVNWAKVHLQCDTYNCGVHVISWLQLWDGTVKDTQGYTMPKYSNEELQQLKVDCLWWLVSHCNNSHAEKVLSMVVGNKNSKRQR